MVTILIVGIGMLLVLEGLNTAKMTAAHTRNLKLSRELALLTLGQIASGQFQDDIENGLQGSYAEEGYPDFSYEVVVGDETFKDNNQESGRFDSWVKRDDTKAAKKKDQKDADPKDKEEPFEKVKIRVTFPQIHIAQKQLKNELVFEEWMPWKQVYGEKETDSKTGAKSPASSSTGSGDTTPPPGGTSQ
jgi:hypothetical protein